MKNIVYLALGSNEGDSERTISTAIAMIADNCGSVIARSSIYQTAAWGLQDQPDFLNMVLCLQTDLQPEPVLHAIRQIEAILGRDRRVTWGQRTIDIDILFYNDSIITTPDLEIPHPRIQDRKFVLIPLTEIAPDLVHPVYSLSATELLARSTDALEVRMFRKHT